MPDTSIKVAELFAGVGGFRLALDGFGKPEDTLYAPHAGNFKTIWANQWEPPGTMARQFAWRCYESHFGEGSCVNRDIEAVLDDYESGAIEIPDVDMVVGGFPCQDYSVAKPLSKAGGIEGKKGVLWWQIYRFLQLKRPRFVLLENVDRLLKSPASQRGRDFAIMLAGFAQLGYAAQWRVINSAEYGFNQRRKRVFIFAELTQEKQSLEQVTKEGILAQALPIKDTTLTSAFTISDDFYELSVDFNDGGKTSPFKTCGAMQSYEVYTCDVVADYKGELGCLGNALVDEADVPQEFYIPEDKLEAWRYLKGSKSEERVNKTTGFKYKYSEGSMAFPDLLTNPARTILTGEGGVGASRFKHIIQIGDRYRRLVPDELDQLQCFPRGWTNTGMTDGQRAFCMGNALVVGIPHRIGKALYNRLKAEAAEQ